MDALITLSQEHRIIEEVLLALDAWTEGVLRAAADDREELARFVSFFRYFADGCHHGKEEKIVFALMANEGLPSDRGPIAVMLAEHERGRSLIGVLDDLARRKNRWDAKDRELLAGTVRSYRYLLTQHIHKEDTILFPMIGCRASAETQAEIARRVERFEADKTGIGEHERLHELAESLITAHLPRQQPEMHAHYG